MTNTKRMQNRCSSCDHQGEWAGDGFDCHAFGRRERGDLAWIGAGEYLGDGQRLDTGDFIVVDPDKFGCLAWVPKQSPITH